MNNASNESSSAVVFESGSSSGSAGSAGVTTSSNAGKGPLRTLGSGETCTYLRLDAASGCRQPRSCESCLETAGCMVDVFGQCSRDSEYAPMRDYREAIEGGYALPDGNASTSAMRYTQRWQFLSEVATYCPLSDTVCQQCKEMNFWRRYMSTPDSRFCLGEGGCVCIDVCEREWFITPDCSRGSSPSATRPSSLYMNSDESFTERLWRGIVGFVAFVVIALFVVWRRHRSTERGERRRSEERRRRREARQQRRHTRSSELGVSTLTLSGWEKHRKDLIDKEQAQLSGQGTSKKDSGDEEDDSSSSEGENTQPTTDYTTLEDREMQAVMEASLVEQPRPSVAPRLPPLSRSIA